MRLFAILSACLLCTSPGRRLHRAVNQPAADHLGSSEGVVHADGPEPVNALATLLLARGSAAAFNLHSPDMHLEGKLGVHAQPMPARATVTAKEKVDWQEDAANLAELDYQARLNAKRLAQSIGKLKKDVAKQKENEAQRRKLSTAQRKATRTPKQSAANSENLAAGFGDASGLSKLEQRVLTLRKDIAKKRVARAEIEKEMEEEEEEEEEDLDLDLEGENEDLFKKEGLLKEVESTIIELYGSVETERVRLFLQRLREKKRLKRKVKVSEKTTLLVELDSYIESLKPKPWLEPSDYRWCKHLKFNWKEVRDELNDALSDEATLKKKGRNVWNHALEEEEDLGWKLLPLCECSTWDEVNSKLFPKTCEVLCNCNVPLTDAYFAKLEPESTTQATSVNCNFELVSSLGLLVPEDQCRQKVGIKKVHFENGQIMLFDPSFQHAADNRAKDQDLYILLLRVYHPELTKIERAALHFAFDCLSRGEGLLISPEALAEYETKRQEAASRRPWKEDDNEKQIDDGEEDNTDRGPIENILEDDILEEDDDALEEDDDILEDDDDDENSDAAQILAEPIRVRKQSGNEKQKDGEAEEATMP
mmetsp:Transcript_13338/g.25161  ORF Transcript_13338/g.25161 Transcript_13338/m.25161 type:complete len:593 (-) Transcript_13338:28-1806(-)